MEKKCKCKSEHGAKHYSFKEKRNYCEICYGMLCSDIFLPKHTDYPILGKSSSRGRVEPLNSIRIALNSVKIVYK